MEFSALWCGLTHFVLGAPVNSTGKIYDCELRHKAVWQKSPTKFEYIHIENALYKRYILTILA